MKRKKLFLQAGILSISLNLFNWSVEDLLSTYVSEKYSKETEFTCITERV